MTRRIVLTAVAALFIVTQPSGPAHAVVIDPGTSGLIFTAVNDPPSSTTTTDHGSSGVTYIHAAADGAGTFDAIDGSTHPGHHFPPAGAPVPEPETWIMMLGGLGLVGVALRRRKSQMRRSFS